MTRSFLRTPRLSFREREEISCRRAAGEGVRVTARALSLCPAISRHSISDLGFAESRDPAMITGLVFY